MEKSITEASAMQVRTRVLLPRYTQSLSSSTLRSRGPGFS